MAAGLLEDVKNYLDITYEDPDGDMKLCGIIQRGEAYLDKVAGKTQDYEKEGLPRALLLNYCRYARNNVIELFKENFQSELVTLRMGVLAVSYTHLDVYKRQVYVIL